MKPARNALPKSAGASQVLVGNTVAGGLRGVLFVLNSLLLLRIMLTRLGPDQFAVFALVYPFLRLGFSGAFDPGVAVGLSRRVSVAWAKADMDCICREFTAAVALFAVLLPLLTAAVWQYRAALAMWLAGSHPVLVASTAHFLWASAVAYSILAAFNPFWGVLMGLHRMAATHLLGSLFLVLEFGLVVGFRNYLSLQTLPWIYGTCGVVCGAASLVLTWRTLPSLRISPGRGALACLPGLLGFSGRMSVTTLTATFSPVIDKAIIARCLGLELVVAYEAASRLADVGRRVTQLFLSPVLPLAGFRQARPESESQRLYRKLYDYNLLVSAAVYLLPLGLAPGLFRLWLGAPRPWTMALYACMAATGFCLSLAGPAIGVWAGRDRLGPLLISGATALGLNLLLTPYLTRMWGWSGLMAGMAVAYGAVNLAILGLLSRTRLTQLSLRGAMPLIFNLVVPFAAIGAAVPLVVSYLVPASLAGTQLATSGLVVAALAAVVLISLSAPRALLHSAINHWRGRTPVAAAPAGMSA